MISNQLITAILVAVGLVALLFLIIYFRKSKKSSAKSGSQTAKQLYVGNLSYRVRERNLSEYFSQFGAVNEVRVVKNRGTGRSKGFGFVTFKTAKQANKALRSHGESFHGRSLVVRIAKDKSAA